MDSHRLDSRLTQLTPMALHVAMRKLCEIDEFKGWWGRQELPGLVSRDSITGRVVEDSVNAFVRLEGRGGGEGGGARSGRDVDEYESPAHAGYAEVLRIVLETYPEMVFEEDLVLQLQARLLRYSHADKAQRGRYRSGADKLGVGRRVRTDPVALMPAAPHLAAPETKALIEWATSRLAYSDFHPLLVVASFLLEFAAIRPFADGNGRLTRILTNLLLLQCGYTQVAYISFDAVLAGRWTPCHLALRRSQATRNLPRPDIAPWLGAFLDVIREHIGKAKALVEQRPDDRLLSANQVAVLRLLERNREITNRLVCRGLDLPRDTAKQALKRLSALGLVERIGAGRSVRYRRVARSGQ